jgi:hypothetical protein
VLLAACGGEPAEERLRQRIDAMQAAMEERRPADFMDGVAADFGGNDGMDRAALHNFLRAQVLRNAALGATRGPTSVEIRGDRAEVRFDVVLTGGAGRMMPERARALSVTSGWRDVDGEWQVYYAEWKPVF